MCSSEKPTGCWTDLWCVPAKHQVVGKELEPAGGAYTKLNDSSFGLFVLKCELKRHIAEY